MKKSSIQYHPNMTQNTGFVVSEKRPDKGQIEVWCFEDLPIFPLHISILWCRTRAMSASVLALPSVRCSALYMPHPLHVSQHQGRSGPIVNRNMSCVEKRSKKEEHSITRHHTNTCMKVISTLSLNLYLNLSSEFFAEIMFVAIRKLTTNMSSTSKIVTHAYDGIPWPYLLFEIQFPKLPFN